MYSLRRFHGRRFDRVNAIIDSLGGHIASYVNLIGSASLPFPEVCHMEGLPGTACRTEGHLAARLFPGTDPIDQAEALVEDCVRRLFGLDESYALSAQPHSATQANQAVFRAVLGDSGGAVVALSPADGGHISHRLGLPSGTEFGAFPLRDGTIDYDALEQEVRRLRPRIVVAGSTSYTREIDFPRLREIADGVGAHLHADLAHTAPFVVGGLHAPVVPFADSITIDPSKSLRGPRGGVLVFRTDDAAGMRRAIFPLLQSSPNQNGLLAKAACFAQWSVEGLRAHATRMVGIARTLGGRLERTLGPPIYGGTDTHLLLFDLSPLSLDGREAEELLAQARILVNRNQIPGDERSPWAPSGIRLGATVPAILDYAEQDVVALGDALCSVVNRDERHAGTIERLLDTYHRPLVNSASESTSGASR